MFIKVNGKNLVVGMKWNVMISDGTISKAVRESKSVWYWHAGPAFYYGIVPRGEKVVKKDLPLHSAMISFATAHSEGNALAILTVPDTDMFVVCGVYQGRPCDGFDAVIPSISSLSEVIDAFTERCGDTSFSLYGDISVQQIIPLTLEELAEHTTDYAELKKVKSELINPITIGIGIAALGFAASAGWDQYVKYRKQEVEKKLAASRKSAQQIYDDAIALKRQEVGLLSEDAPKILNEFLNLPATVGGWDLERANCKVSQVKTLNCTLRFLKSKSHEVSNQSFLKASSHLGFTSIAYKPDLKVIEAVWIVKNLPFVTVGKAMDMAISQNQQWIQFGSQLQRLLPFGSPTFSAFTPIIQPSGAGAGQVMLSPIVNATWSPSGPARILELFESFPKYALLNNVNFFVEKSPKFRFNESFLKVQVDGTVFAKNN